MNPDLQHKLKDCCQEMRNDCENKIRSAPLLSVGYAAMAGFLCHLLPVGGIVSALVRASTSLAKPALVILIALQAARALGISAKITAGSKPLSNPPPGPPAA